MSGAPAVTVVIPTHNRAASLRRTLEALGRQTSPPDRLDVVVVADGCTDGTKHVAAAVTLPFPLRLVEQPRGGPAAARNAGAAAASGSLLVFLDDDVEAAPRLIAAHVDAHQRRPGGIVIGRLFPLLAAQRGFFRIVLRRWWEAKFDALAQPSHRFHAFDLLSGNCSLAADLFARCGGFDRTLRCHEDYELGIRLMSQGVPFTYAPEAAGRHHESTDLIGALRRKFDEGRADVLIGRRHPRIRPALPMTRLQPRRAGTRATLHRLAFTRSPVGAAAAAVGVRLLGVLEALRFRSRWRRLLDDLLTYWYWRGMAQELRTPAEAAAFIAGVVVEAAPEVDVDLRTGMDQARRLLDATRPEAIRLRFGARAIARMHPIPGAEPLRGDHLPFILGGHLARPLLRAMVGDGAIAPPFNVARLLELSAVPPRYDLREYGIEPG